MIWEQARVDYVPKLSVAVVKHHWQSWALKGLLELHHHCLQMFIFYYLHCGLHCLPLFAYVMLSVSFPNITDISLPYKVIRGRSDKRSNVDTKDLYHFVHQKRAARPGSLTFGHLYNPTVTVCSAKLEFT